MEENYIYILGKKYFYIRNDPNYKLCVKNCIVYINGEKAEEIKD